MLGTLIEVIFRNPGRLPFLLRRKWYLRRLASRPNIQLRGRVHLAGLPMIDIHPEASLVIGDQVTLDSDNRGYHLNMHSPVKLLADEPGARLTIGAKTRIHGTCIHACLSVTIGDHCLIAANCQIIDSSGHLLSFPDVENRINTRSDPKPVVIEDHVWIGAGSVILPGVTIGRGSVLAAGSVVVKDIPPMVVAGGNPAKVIRDYGQFPGRT
ncbi:acyltransferase [Geothrix sp. 21YS21S-2]|uniref:acyltransferase n=1 Tax=Geothrix sp. 21YS21S-2 TaxID=3068893 RepID=UPI0027B8FB8B|nr:acyltransferase [Geothrix sp. 21YS21S-2]